MQCAPISQAGRHDRSGERLERMEDDILDARECAGLQPIKNQRLDFGAGDLDGHAGGAVSTLPRGHPQPLRLAERLNP